MCGGIFNHLLIGEVIVNGIIVLFILFYFFSDKNVFVCTSHTTGMPQKIKAADLLDYCGSLWCVLI